MAVIEKLAKGYGKNRRRRPRAPRFDILGYRDETIPLGFQERLREGETITLVRAPTDCFTPFTSKFSSPEIQTLPLHPDVASSYSSELGFVSKGTHKQQKFEVEPSRTVTDLTFKMKNESEDEKKAICTRDCKTLRRYGGNKSNGTSMQQLRVHHRQYRNNRRSRFTPYGRATRHSTVRYKSTANKWNNIANSAGKQGKFGTVRHLHFKEDSRSEEASSLRITA